MKKKIKDLTLVEAMKICDISLCKNCPLHRQSKVKSYDTCPKFPSDFTENSSAVHFESGAEWIHKYGDDEVDVPDSFSKQETKNDC